MRSAEPAVDCFRDIEPHPRRAGRRDQRNPPISRELSADGVAVADEQRKIAGSAPVSRQTRSAILVTAMAVSGVFSDGFQIVASPQTAASAAFHDQTATGKLKAEMTADHAERMPLLHQAMIRPFRLNRQAVKHARLADGEIADVDHLLHFAFAFGDDLARSRA